jgi:hypothetical protein
MALLPAQDRQEFDPSNAQCFLLKTDYVGCPA